METTLFYLVPVASVLALVFAWHFYREMKKAPEGTPRMKHIAEAVRKGAMSYLRQQYKVVTVVFIALAALFAVMAYGFQVQNEWVPIAFLTGGFQIVLNGDGGAQRTCTQQVMAATMTGAAANQLFADGGVCFLRQAGQCIILSQNADHRFTGAVGRFECSINTTDRTFHIEALFFENLHIEFAGFEFHQRKLCIFPDFIGYIGNDVCFFINNLQIFLFVRHFNFSPQCNLYRKSRTKCGFCFSRALCPGILLF